MKELGQSLVFFLRYYPEMERAYGQGKPIRGVNRLEVQKVGKRAGIEAHQLLRSCIEDYVRKLESLPKVVRIDGKTRESTIHRDWSLGMNLWRPEMRRSNSVQRQFGIYISEEAELIPWLWRRGGLAVEEEIKALLKRHGHKSTCYGSKSFNDYDSGAVALAKIPLLKGRRQRGDFTIEAASIIKEAKQSLGVMTPDFMRKFLE